MAKFVHLMFTPYSGTQAELLLPLQNLGFGFQEIRLKLGEEPKKTTQTLTQLKLLLYKISSHFCISIIL